MTKQELLDFYPSSDWKKFILWVYKQPKDRVFKESYDECILSAYYNEICECGDKDHQSCLYEISNSVDETCYTLPHRLAAIVSSSLEDAIPAKTYWSTVTYTTAQFLKVLKQTLTNSMFIRKGVFY